MGFEKGKRVMISGLMITKLKDAYLKNILELINKPL